MHVEYFTNLNFISRLIKSFWTAYGFTVYEFFPFLSFLQQFADFFFLCCSCCLHCVTVIFVAFVSFILLVFTINSPEMFVNLFLKFVWVFLRLLELDRSSSSPEWTPQKTKSVASPSIHRMSLLFATYISCRKEHHGNYTKTLSFHRLSVLQ